MTITATLFTLEGDPVDSATTENTNYLLEGIVEGDYYYTIVDSTLAKGTIKDFITIPNTTDYGTGFQFIKQLDHYDAAPDTTINLYDEADALITTGNITVTAANLDCAETGSTGVFTATLIPENPNGTLITYVDSDGLLEPLVEKVTFPIAGGTDIHNVQLMPLFLTTLSFKIGTVSINSSIQTVKIQHIYSNSVVAAPLISLTKPSASNIWSLPATESYTGAINIYVTYAPGTGITIASTQLLNRPITSAGSGQTCLIAVEGTYTFTE